MGLLQTDGSHNGSIEGQGKIALELAVRDATVLEQISEIVPCYSSVRRRTRATNFKAAYETATLGISFITASVALSTYFCEVIAEVCGVSRTARPNTRDGVHNIMVTNVAAARLASWAWHSPDVLGIERKRQAAADVASWRPAAGREGRYGVVRRRWTPEDDEIVLSGTAEEAARALDRALSSVSMRRWRLAKTQTTHR